MERTEDPRWQPLTRLPRVASMIDAGLADARKQHEHLLRSQAPPYVLDDHTVARVVQLFTDTQDNLPFYEEQLRRWTGESPTPAQRREIERLSDELPRLRETVATILTLAEELKRGTIERTLVKRPGGRPRPLGGPSAV